MPSPPLPEAIEKTIRLVVRNGRRDVDLLRRAIAAYGLRERIAGLEEADPEYLYHRKHVEDLKAQAAALEAEEK